MAFLERISQEEKVFLLEGQDALLSRKLFMRRDRFNPRTWAGREMNERDLQILALREKGYNFQEIGKRVKNENTGKIGISRSAAAVAHFYALARKPRYARKQEKAAKIAYVQSICQILMDETKYIYQKDRR